MMKNVRAEIITIGDEILIGQIVDTNSAWMARELNAIGVAVYQITSVSDNKDHIVKALDEATQRVPIVLITGGLGPTRDDITKKTLADYFHSKLVLNKQVYDAVEARLKKRNIPMTEVGKGQALVPEGCRAFVNEWGTAPAMMFDTGSGMVVSMPGVPVEMKGLMQKYILQEIQNRFDLPAIEHRTFLTYGTYEARLSKMLEPFENHLPPHIKLAYLPSQGRVRLRLSGTGADRQSLSVEMDRYETELRKIVGNYIYGTGEEALEEVVGALLHKRKATLATAESCTGGFIAHLITTVPGASDYFLGGVVAYSNDVKIKELDVHPETIEQFGAVSEETVREMASGVCKKTGADYGIAVSGIAGPSGGTPEKPVGTVWIAVAGPVGIDTEMLSLAFSRLENITRSGYAAINLLRRILQRKS